MSASMPERDDSHLAPILLAASRGDEQAWREVLRLYARRVFALAKSHCRNDDVAEEITQSVFATIAGKLGGGEYREQGRFESWLFRVTMNRVRDHVRRARRRRGHVPIDEQIPGPGPSNEPAAPNLEALRSALARLPDADREIIELRHHGQLSFKAMADLLDEPMGTLLARHHRALKKLKALLEGQTAVEGMGEVGS